MSIDLNKFSREELAYLAKKIQAVGAGGDGSLLNEVEAALEKRRSDDAKTLPEKLVDMGVSEILHDGDVNPHLTASCYLQGSVTTSKIEAKVKKLKEAGIKTKFGFDGSYLTVSFSNEDDE